MRRTVVPLWLAAAAEPRAGAFIVLFSIEAWSRTILITLVPLQAHKLLGDAQSVSFVYFIVSVSGLLSTMFVPTVVHLIRRRWAFSLGAMLMFAALAGYAAADPMIFPLALGCQVVATAFLEIVMNLFVLDHVPRTEISKFEPRRLLSVAAPFTFGPFFGVWLAETISLQVTMIVVAAFVGLLLGYFWFLRLTDNPAVTMPLKPPPNPLKYLPRFFAQPRLRLAWVLATGRSSWWVMFFVYAPIYLTSNGYSPETAGLIVSVGSASLFLSAAWGALGRKVGMRFVLILGYASAGAITIMIALVQDWPTVVLALIAISAFAAAIVDGAGNIPFLRAVHPYERAEMTSVFVTYRHTAQLVTPGAFSLVLGFFALPAVFVAGGAGFLSMAWLARYLPKRL
ncbi:MAG: MFS transporter [Rhodospirillales bacterium]|nr:MFS transporter [Rhodospirillales bacterium]MBO6786298.1 MFS transporter [Rhodospirillales bacterium]